MAVVLVGESVAQPRSGPIAEILEKIDQIFEVLTGADSTISGIETEVQNIEAKLDDPGFGLKEIKNEVRNIEDNQVAIMDQIQSIEESRYVPFRARPAGFALHNCGTKDTPGGLVIGISSSAESGHFLVTSIAVRVGAIEDSGDKLEIGDIIVNGHDIMSQNSEDLIQKVQDSLTNELAFEVLGASLRGGPASIPHQIAARSDGVGEVEIEVGLFCDGTGEFFAPNIENPDVAVSGWKRIDDTITVEVVSL